MDGCIFRKTTGLKISQMQQRVWTIDLKILMKIMKMKKATNGLRKQSVQNVDE